MSEYDDRAAKDRDVDIPAAIETGQNLGAATATLKNEEDVEANDRAHATGATQAAINREEDPPA